MFSPGAVLAAQATVALVIVGLVVGVPAFGTWREAAYQALGEPVAQPIPFSHKHHVGDDGIDCRYCHTTVETSRHAGFPSTRICLTCHSQLYTDAPVLAALHESGRTGIPIAWRRVHTLPDFVYFDHGVHVAKGVACVECHGHVDQMPLTWRAKPLQMQWCIDCHRSPAPHLHPRASIFDPRATAVSASEAANLARLMHLESQQRLTDCSTCHR
ncbi:MAG TPA: cytochrome c3 family protein [Ramlibacter sp.]|uniref:cytochrome c3 family protein n=1 Tax=Ramlibacter sp. TaxID=1917967 RepID=UPI002CBBB35B|nr:cytochrome c3 family protein [Ramlibacter sp.]HVZ46327.1 cytochrome c3 family protein [Ramlibacter sp.]